MTFSLIIISQYDNMNLARAAHITLCLWPSASWNCLNSCSTYGGRSARLLSAHQQCLRRRSYSSVWGHVSRAGSGWWLVVTDVTRRKRIQWTTGHGGAPAGAVRRGRRELLLGATARAAPRVYACGWLALATGGSCAVIAMDTATNTEVTNRNVGCNNLSSKV